MPKVVSLIASATEIVCALGFEDCLVGRSHECDYPESVRWLPVCTEPKFYTSGSSYEIDQRIKAILQEALSVYRVDAETLKRLKPEVILTQSHCEVCAVSLKDVEEAVYRWLGQKPKILSLEANLLSDLWKNILLVAESLGARERGLRLVESLKERVEAISAKARTAPRKPAVACVEWMEPLMAAGNWMPELVELAGGRNLFGVAGVHSPMLSWAELSEKDPDVIVIMPCGFDIARTRSDIESLTSKEGWGRLKAVKGGQVYLADGNQYFNRPGPRLVESLEILAEILHPELFHFGHEGSGWQRL